MNQNGMSLCSVSSTVIFIIHFALKLPVLIWEFSRSFLSCGSLKKKKAGESVWNETGLKCQHTLNVLWLISPENSKTEPMWWFIASRLFLLVQLSKTQKHALKKLFFFSPFQHLVVENSFRAWSQVTVQPLTWSKCGSHHSKYPYISSDIISLQSPPDLHARRVLYFDRMLLKHCQNLLVVFVLLSCIEKHVLHITGCSNFTLMPERLFELDDVNMILVRKREERIGAISISVHTLFEYRVYLICQMRLATYQMAPSTPPPPKKTYLQLQWKFVYRMRYGPDQPTTPENS